jgi:histidinol-phosphatase (PHP family)
MKFDLHTHHYRCGHAQGEIHDYIEAAIKADMQVIGISDHSPFFAHESEQQFPQIAMAKQEFPLYVAEVLQLKQQYASKINVLLGVESDFFHEHAEIYRLQYAKYPFDYIIGSVHVSGGVSIFNKNRWNDIREDEVLRHKEEYYRYIQLSAKSGMFQVLGHIDAMKAYYPEFSNVRTPIVDETLQIISEYGVAIEVNTSGSTKLVGGWYPTDDILERALYYAVDITFGSDAHVPSRVGDDWEKVQEKLRDIGFTSWVYYQNKQRQVVSL